MRDLLARRRDDVGLRGGLLGVARHLLADRRQFLGGGGQRGRVLRRDLERLDHRLERLVDTFDDLAVVALVLGGVGAHAHPAVRGRLGQRAGVGHQRVDVVLQQHQPLVNLVLARKPWPSRRVMSPLAILVT